MKELWTIELEVDLETMNSIWPHMDKKECMEIYNGDDGIRKILADGIHWHNHMRCNKELDWKLIKRKPLNNIIGEL